MMKGKDGWRIFVSASRLRSAIMRLPQSEAVNLVLALWPDMAPERASMLVRNAKETCVNGGWLSMPKSWDDLLPRNR